MLYNQNRQYPPLKPAVDAPRETATLADVAVSYYADTTGTGRPLLLLHSINAAPSVYEVKPLFEHYQGKRPVYAPDLPGFGFSNRDPRRYSPELYAQTITEMLRDVIGEPADVVALSLGSEFAAIAALENPDLFHSLTVISPTGFSEIDVAAFIPGQTIHKFLTIPLLDQGLFDLLTRRGTVAYYLGQSFVGEPPQDFIDYAYTTAHQRGARHAPLYFLSGQLFSGGVAESVYAKLTVPVLMIYDEDPNVNFARLPKLLQANDAWRAEKLIPSRGLPHWERLDDTVALLETFWAE